LSQLNLLLGKADDKRSAAVAFDDLVMAASDYERKGLAKELGKVIAHDAVLIALVAAAMHEIHGRAMRGEVRQRAKQLLRFVNPTKSATMMLARIAPHTPGFCNGPWFVNPSFHLRRPFAGVLLLSGVSAMGCHLTGFEEDRSANLE
jgi:hypothetical protein